MNRNRILILALVISIAINILLVGIGVGRVLGGPGPGFRDAKPMHMSWIMRDMSKEQREELRPQLEEGFRAMIPLRRDMRDAQKDFHELLAQEDLDQAELEAALNRIGAASAALQNGMHQQMAETLAALPPEERQRVAKFLERRHDRGRMRHHRRDGHKPRD